MCLAGAGEGGVARALVKHMFSFAMQSLIIDNSLPLFLLLPWGFPPPHQTCSCMCVSAVRTLLYAIGV